MSMSNDTKCEMSPTQSVTEWLMAIPDGGKNRRKGSTTHCGDIKRRKEWKEVL